MNTTRIFTLAGRVARQIMRDRRTIGLFLIAPMIVLALGALLLRSEAGAIPVGIVNTDEGATVLLVGEVNLGQRIVDAMQESEGLIPVVLDADEIDDALRDGRVQGVVSFPADFSATFASTRHATIPLRLEGSDPTQALSLTGNLLRAAIRAFATLTPAIMGTASTDPDELPISIETEYLYGGPEYDMLDYFAPVYIALIVFFFVFILTAVSFLRERSQGTMERLLATPASRFEIVTGYMLGFLVFALAQAALLLIFTVVVIQIHYAGNLLNVFLAETLLVFVAVNLGIFLSTFARNEFQVVQFIPIVIFPLVLLSGLVWPVEDLPGLLRPIAYFLPLTYVNEALRGVMIKGLGLGDILPQLIILAGFAVLLLIAAAASIRREVA
ncbi:MAG: ABC transporter permease [Anaerolineae bacterium]|nr:ABC transporter permease [Anaerolineae bacterium]